MRQFAQAILSDKPEPPGRLNPAVSPELARIVLRLLAKDPTQRFSGAEEVTKALNSLTLAGRGGAAFSPLQGLRTRVRYLYGAMGTMGLLGASLALFFFLAEGNTLVQPTSPANASPLPSDEPKPVTEKGPSEAALFDEARAALSRGDLEVSKARLEALLQRNPGYAGVAELLLELNDQQWKRANLPMSFQATHDHRIGECSGTLTLEDWGIRYHSEKHEWRWHLDQIRLLERVNRRHLNVETHDKDILVLGKPKRYKFSLSTSLKDDTWSRYQRLASGHVPAATKR